MIALRPPPATVVSRRKVGGCEGRKPLLANVVVDPIRDPSGTLVGYAKITRDLTDRRAAELSFGASEERFRLLVQSVTTTQSTCWTQKAGSAAERRRRAIQGVCCRRDHGRALLPILHRRGLATPGSPHCARDFPLGGRFEAEGWSNT